MSIYGNTDGEKIFNIPVEWTVSDTIKIRANSLEEAITFMQENEDYIPISDEGCYVDDSYHISADGEEVAEIAEGIKDIYGDYYFCPVEEYHDEVTLLANQQRVIER